MHRAAISLIYLWRCQDIAVRLAFYFGFLTLYLQILLTLRAACKDRKAKGNVVECLSQ